MTEGEWLECTDPEAMLKVLQGKASDRKLRSFACACCRHIWQLLDKPQSRTAVEMTERFADGEISQDQLNDAAQAVRGAAWSWSQYAEPALVAARSASGSAANVAAIHGTHTDQNVSWNQVRLKERAEQCCLLRDVVGMLPFKSLSVDSSWLSWSDAVVVKLAQGIYDNRAFDQLPILADALEEAGCTTMDILTHLRGTGPHVLGCWVVDLCLGRDWANPYPPLITTLEDENLPF
jgi:hypothetical protein